MRPLLLSISGQKAGRSYFQLFLASSIGHAGRSFLLLQSCLCQYVKDLFPKKGKRGEYRGRTDDLLHAMQAL